ncbi:MAG: pyridoxamine 5'-phosphate oxidase family protein [Actinomycetota bacterium]|nr:pyridoxamine 5'-phosphate oxidase family protein [Actinomycetota bacterium]
MVLRVTERTRLRRMPERVSLERRDLEEILDAGFVCHLGVLDGDAPLVLPTVYGRDGDRLYVHGSVASRSLRTARAERPVCVTVTLVDGIVVARSVFEHSVNYRSVVVLGVPEVLEGEEKVAALRVLTEHVVHGQWDYARRPTRQELAQTTVLALDLGEVSVKMRSGPSEDGDGPDAALPVWAGEIPLRVVASPPVADPALLPGVAVPAHLESVVAGMSARFAPRPSRPASGRAR